MKKFTLELTDTTTDDVTEFNFEVTPDKYSKFLNASATSKDKVAPMHNFVVNCVEKSQRDQLSDLLRAPENDGLSTMVASELVEAYLPKVEISVKKPLPMLTESGETD